MDTVFISELEIKGTISTHDYLALDNANDNKTYKLKADRLLPYTVWFITPSSEWKCPIPQNTKPFVLIFDEDSNRVESSILIDADEIVVSFNSPLSGYLVIYGT